MPELPRNENRRKSFATRTGNGYGKKWERYSKRYRRKNAFCAVWMELGKVKKADVVDHIVRVEDGGSMWDEENHIQMSHFWHNRKSALESRDAFKIKSKPGRGGLVPIDRDDVIRIILDRYKNQLYNYV